MNCNHCGTTLPEGVSVCTVCGTPVQAATAGPEILPVRENLGLGILGAIGGALIGGASIILLSRLGFIAAISGFLIAFCTLKGYELLGKQLSRTGVIISIILMVVTPFLAYNLDLIWQFYNELKVFGLTLGDCVPFLVDLIQEDAELMRMYLSEMGMLYLFVAIGAFSTIRNAMRKV